MHSQTAPLRLKQKQLLSYLLPLGRKAKQHLSKRFALLWTGTHWQPLGRGRHGQHLLHAGKLSILLWMLSLPLSVPSACRGCAPDEDESPEPQGGPRTKPWSLPWASASAAGQIPGTLRHHSLQGAATTPNTAPEVIKSLLLGAIPLQTAWQKWSLKPLTITSPAASFDFRYRPPATTRHRYLLPPSPTG